MTKPAAALPPNASLAIPPVGITTSLPLQHVSPAEYCVLSTRELLHCFPLTRHFCLSDSNARSMDLDAGDSPWGGKFKQH